MSGRGSRKRGRPPKTPNDRSATKFNYHLLKKPKYLSKASESRTSTPSASRASSPQESDGSRSTRKYTPKSRGGRGRKSISNHNSSSRKARQITSSFRVMQINIAFLEGFKFTKEQS